MARDALKEKIATYQQGVTIRKHETEEAKISAAKDEAELSKLKSEEKVLKGIVEHLKGIFNVFSAWSFNYNWFSYHNITLYQHVLLD